MGAPISDVSTAERRQFIDERLNTDWGWIDYEKGPAGYSYRDIMLACMRRFGKDRVPRHTMTYKRDILLLKGAADVPDVEELTEAQRLLDPNLFPEWRSTFFRVPETGEPFQTPKFQHAIFWVMHAATFKIELPQWVIDYLDELDPKHPFPENINELITGKQKSFLSFLLLMAPRHGKTELVIHFIMHTYAMDQNKRIMFGNGTQKKSEGFIDNAVMSMMEAMDELSEKFVEMYGPFRHDDRPWSRQGFTLAGRDYTNKMYSMQPYGISGNIRSFDSDAIIGDDLSDLQRSRSESTTDGDYGWITTELMLRREYNTSLLLLGSHVAVQSGDLFTRILNNLEKLNVGRQTMIVKAIPAHFYDKCDPVNDPDHNNCVLWPDVRDYGFLEAQRAAMEDDAMFEAVYNQVPMQPKMLHFPPDVMREAYPQIGYDEALGKTPPPSKDNAIGVLDYQRSWRELPIYCCKKETAVGLGFDPAASESKGASFTAVSVKAACTKCGRRYWVDYGQERMSPEMHPDYIEQFVSEYPQIEVATIEINAYQKSLARDPRLDRLQERYKFYVKEWTTDERKHDPDFGIPQYGRHYKSGMVSIPFSTLYDQEFAEPLIKTFIRWPQKPNDLVMSGWLCDRGLDEILEMSRYATPEQVPGSEQWETQWHRDNTFTVDLSLQFDDVGDYV